MRAVFSVVFHNLFLKFTALAIAILTWSYIVGQIYDETPWPHKNSQTVVNIEDKNVIVKRLPVHVNLTGTPEKRYDVAVDRISISPTECVVTGPLEVIENLTFVTTEPISVEGLTRSIKQKANLRQPQSCQINEEREFFVTVPIIRKRSIK